MQRIVAEQLLACTPAQRAMFERIRIAPRRLPILRGNSIEHVFAVAEVADQLLFWEDVEEGFELARPGADGVLRDDGADQLEMTHVLHQLLERDARRE
ncbi:MAG: hypothetical protein L6Q95_13450 [Planctomycetes bacterium]|nr:hypothetical protein [Planctomycetota bacterium]